MIRNLLVFAILVARNLQIMAPFLDSDEIWDFGTGVVAKNMDLDNIMGLGTRGRFEPTFDVPGDINTTFAVPGDINISNSKF